MGLDMSARIAVVTGGSGLLGSRICKHLQGRGFQVTSLDISEPNIKHDGVSYRICDITKRDQVQEEIKFLCKKNEITTIVHSAAIDPKVTNQSGQAIPFEEESFNSLAGEFEISIRGGLNVVQSFLRFGIRDLSTSKSIIFIGSDLSVISPDQRVYLDKEGRQTFFKPISYSITKHGVVGMTKYLATMLADRNVRVNCLSPGPILDRQPELLRNNLESRIPMGRLASFEEIVSVVHFLAAEDSQYITGQNIVVDGGRTTW
jgi:NAD(P)-dependent dehydrogenase (short-subunit alcohol dehydrogenase family)